LKIECKIIEVVFFYEEKGQYHMSEHDEDAGEQRRVLNSPPFAVQLHDIVSIDIVAKRFPVDLPPDMSVNIHTSIDDIAVDAEDLHAQVIVVTNVEPTTTSLPFEISVRVLGLFSYSDEYKADDVKAYLKASSLSLMLPFIRELIHHLSMRLRIPAIVLPLIELADPTDREQ
jgi:preprotein translocase subunit SecB